MAQTSRGGWWHRGRGWLASLCLVVGGVSLVSSAPLPYFAKALMLGPAAEWRFGPLVLDVTRDGVPDLVATARLLDPALHLWRGDGQAFTPVPATWTDIGYAAVASGDINQDGWPDLVSASHFGTIQTLLSDGQGGFTEVSMACDDGAVAVHLAELTGDGQVDLVRVGFQTAGLEVYAGDGRGHWTRHTRLPDPRPGRTLPGRALAVGDLNHDGHLDLVAAFNRWGVYLYYGDGQGGFTGGPVDFLAPRAFDSLGSTLALADVNHDGHPDLVLNGTVDGPGQRHGPEVYLGDGHGGWNASSEGLKALHVAAPGLAVGDVDQDGHVDLIAGGAVSGPQAAGYGLFWFKGDGQGHWQLVSASGLPAQGLAIPHGMALADLDRDGCPELITLHGGREGHLTTWRRPACRDSGRATWPSEEGGGSTPMAANRDHPGTARGRLGVVTALLVGLLAGPGTGAPAPAGVRLRITAQHGRLSVDVHQAEIGAVLAQIGAQAGVRIVFAPPAARQVSAQFSGVELDAGLRHLLRLAALSYLILYGQGPTGAPVVQEVRVYGGEARVGELAAAAPDPEATDAPGAARDAPARTLRGQIAALAARAAAEAPRKTAPWPEAEVATRLRHMFTPPPGTAPPEDQGQEPPDAAAASR